LRNAQVRYILLSGFSLYALLSYGLVLFHQSYLPYASRLTEFKTAGEWGAISLLVIAASRFWQTMNIDSRKIYFFTAVMVFIISELFFIQYKNVLGHFYKIIGGFLLYRAVSMNSIEAPFHEGEQQQSRYRQLFENMPSCCMVYKAIDNDDDFTLMEINYAAERTEKISRDDFIGGKVTELFPSVSAFGLPDVLRRVLRTGQAEHFPVKYYQDGRIVGWRENYLYRLAGGEVVVIYDNVTERESAKQALQKSERNFRAVFETAAIGMVETDLIAGKFLRVNLKFCQMTGYSEEELLTTTIANITHPDDREKDREGMSRMMQGENHEYVTEKRYIHKDGNEIRVHLNAVALRDENGSALHSLAAIVDITARKQSEADLRRSEQELKSIFDALPDFYFHLGADGTILSYHASPAAMDELHVPPEQFLGRRITDVLPQEQAALFAANLKEQQGSGKIITFEYPLTVPRGECYYEARLASLVDSSDVIVLIRNIMERKQLEKQLQQAQKMEALGQLTGGIAHDFNNILAVVLGYSNLALERCVSDPSDKLARYLKEVIFASERARDLIAKMLAYSRTSPVVASTPLDIASEVEKAVAMLSAAIPAGIDVSTHIETNIPPVRIDPIEVQQVLINLAVNARDAIGEQGHIDITLKCTRIYHKVCAICHNIIDGKYVVLEVKDNGNGIPKNVRQRIFDPFFTTKEIGKGSGLGLSMVQGVVIKNNAHLLIESSFEHGTSFRLLFPFLDTDAVSSEFPTSKSVALMTAHWRIWVVEDQKSLADYYQELLQGQGCLVTVFTDPINALCAFQLDPGSVDMVLTDQTMPYLSGDRLAVAMLAIKPELPIILITGYSDKINADEAKRLGIRCYLNKPVDGNKLLEILAAELN